MQVYQTRVGGGKQFTDSEAVKIRELINKPLVQNTIEPVVLSVDSLIDTKVKVSFTGGTGGIGNHTYYFEYKLSSSANNWQTIPNYSPMIKSGELTDNERIFQFFDLADDKNYDIRLTVTDSEGFSKTDIINNVSTLLRILTGTANASTTNVQVSASKLDSQTEEKTLYIYRNGVLISSAKLTTTGTTLQLYSVNVGDEFLLLASNGSKIKALSSNSSVIENDITRSVGLNLISMNLGRVTTNTTTISGTVVSRFNVSDYPMLETMHLSTGNVLFTANSVHTNLTSLTGSKAAWYCLDWSIIPNIEILYTYQTRHSIYQALRDDEIGDGQTHYLDLSPLTSLVAYSMSGSGSDRPKIFKFPNSPSLELFAPSFIDVSGIHNNTIDFSSSTNLRIFSMYVMSGMSSITTPIDFSATKLREINFGGNSNYSNRIAGSALPNTLHTYKYGDTADGSTAGTTQHRQIFADIVAKMAWGTEDADLDNTPLTYLLNTSKTYSAYKKVVSNDAYVDLSLKDTLGYNKTTQESINHLINNRSFSVDLIQN